MPNLFRSGSDTTITGSIYKGPFTIGVTTASIKGPTVADTGFYNGITPVSGGYCVYAIKSTQGPSIRTAADVTELGKISVAYGNAVNQTGSLARIMNFFEANGYVVTNFDYGNIVTSGCIGVLDASFLPSYNQTTTNSNIVYDLSGKAATGSFNGNVTWVNGYTQSYFSFPSSNTSSFISSTVTQSYIDFTMILQPDFSLTTTSTLVGLIATSTPNTGQDKSLRMVITGSTWTMNGRNPGDANDWANPSASTFYVNGVSGSTLTSGSAWYCFGGARTNTTSGAFSGSFPYYLGTTGFNGDNRNFQGKIAVTLLYNRALSAAEQLQNFNALRGRFGI
jgi:hypothetical protein